MFCFRDGRQSAPASSVRGWQRAKTLGNRSRLLMSWVQPRLMSFEDDVTMKQVPLVRRRLTGYFHSGVHSLLESVGECRMLAPPP